MFCGFVWLDGRISDVRWHGFGQAFVEMVIDFSQIFGWGSLSGGGMVRLWAIKFVFTEG